MRTHSKIASIKFLVFLMVTALPAYGAGDICVESELRTTGIIKNTKASWNGEVFTVRYFNNSSDPGIVRLVYWTRDGDRKEAFDRLSSMAAALLREDGWMTFQISLPERPSQYQLERADSYCVKTRPKTFWERVDDALQ